MLSDWCLHLSLCGIIHDSMLRVGGGVWEGVCFLRGEGKRHKVAENESKLSREAAWVCRAVLRAAIANVQQFQFHWLLRDCLSRLVSLMQSGKASGEAHWVQLHREDRVQEGICKRKNSDSLKNTENLQEKIFIKVKMIETLNFFPILTYSSPSMVA